MGGIRFIDLRFSVKDGVLKAYHGFYPQRSTAIKLFAQLYQFLSEKPTETVIVSIKQEDSDTHFFPLLMSLLQANVTLWYLAASFPILGDVRGKAILFSRFGIGPNSELSFSTFISRKLIL